MAIQLFVVPKTVSPLHVWSKVCIAPFYVRSKDHKFASHLEWSNADFAPHMEGSNADFAPHMERRHSFRDQQIAKISISANIFVSFFQTTFILGIYMIYVTTFEKKNPAYGRHQLSRPMRIGDTASLCINLSPKTVQFSPPIFGQFCEKLIFFFPP